MRHILFTPAETAAQIDDDLRIKIARLPVDQRLVFTLVYLEELSLSQVAEVIDEPEDDVAALFYWAHAGIGAVPAVPLETVAA